MKNNEDRKYKLSPIKIAIWAVLFGIFVTIPCTRKTAVNLYNNTHRQIDNTYRQAYNLLHKQKKEKPKIPNVFYTVEPVIVNTTQKPTYNLASQDTLPGEPGKPVVTVKTPEYKGTVKRIAKQNCNEVKGDNIERKLNINIKNHLGGVKIYRITANGDTLLEKVSVPETSWTNNF